jgi:hypothetical protein
MAKTPDGVGGRMPVCGNRMPIPGGCADDGKRAADAVDDVAEIDVVTYVVVSMSIFFC